MKTSKEHDSKFVEFAVASSSNTSLRCVFKLAVLARAGFEPLDLFARRAEQARIYVRDHAGKETTARGSCYRTYVTTDLYVKAKYALVSFDVMGTRPGVARFAIQARKLACSVPVEFTMKTPAKWRQPPPPPARKRRYDTSAENQLQLDTPQWVSYKKPASITMTVPD